MSARTQINVKSYAISNFTKVTKKILFHVPPFRPRLAPHQPQAGETGGGHGGLREGSCHKPGEHQGEDIQGGGSLQYGTLREGAGGVREGEMDQSVVYSAWTSRDGD